MMPGIRKTLLFALFFAVSLLSCDKPSEMARTSINAPLPAGAHKAKIKIVSAMEVMPIDTLTEVKLKIKNKSPFLWPSGDSRPGVPYNIYVSYHWLGRNGKVISDGRKTPLTRDIPPGGEAIVYVKVNSIMQGDYILEFDLYQEGAGWFKQNGSKTARMQVRILSSI